MKKESTNTEAKSKPEKKAETETKALLGKKVNQEKKMEDSNVRKMEKENHE